MNITMPKWKTPEDYFGFNPVGHYGVMNRTRDSSIMEESNWDAAVARLSKAWGQPVEFSDSGADDGSDAPVVYFWRAGHWAVGWVEYLMVRPDAPQAVLEAAQEIKEGIDDYPILDEDDYSTRQYNAIHEYWDGLSDEGKAREIADAGAEPMEDGSLPEKVYEHFNDSGAFA